VKVNALVPGVNNNPPAEFVKKFKDLIPMGMMAKVDEYPFAAIFLVNNESSYMKVSNMNIDCGRTCW